MKKIIFIICTLLIFCGCSNSERIIKIQAKVLDNTYDTLQVSTDEGEYIVSTDDVTFVDDFGTLIFIDDINKEDVIDIFYNIEDGIESAHRIVVKE